MRAIRRSARIAVARSKALRRHVPLPPGNFFPIARYLAADRKGLVDKAAKLGPLLTAVWDQHVAIWVIGFSTARRLLAAHAADLRPLSINLRPIVPNGFLRTMEGDLHKRYRPIFSRAFDARILDDLEPEIRAVIRDGLKQYAATDGSADRRLRVLERMTARLLIEACLGISRNHTDFAEFEAQFLLLGRNRFVWRLGDEQRRAFAQIRRRLETLLEKPSGVPGAIAGNSVLGRLGSAQALDDTTIGNLIYMVEMGRHDLKNYFAWITRLTEPRQHALARAAAGEVGANGCPYSKAIAFETLRMEQSERLMRKASRDFVFDGFLFPKNAVVCISLWEAHKNSDSFADPYAFDPDRFLVNNYGLNRYAPFGLDQHRCPAADIVIRLAAIFVEMHAVECGLTDQACHPFH